MCFYILNFSKSVKDNSLEGVEISRFLFSTRDVQGFWEPYLQH